ncbi:FtsK/SpoIIIE family protein [compost metagenome]
MPEFRTRNMEEMIQDFEHFVRENLVAPAAPIPIMPSKIDMSDINRDGELLAIGLGDHDLMPVYVDLTATPVIMIAGDAMSGKSTQLVSWISMLNEKLGSDRLDVYALDSSSMGIYELMKLPCVTDLSQIEDMYDFIDAMKQELDDRRARFLATRQANGDLNALVRSWKQIIFVIDNLSELTNGDQYSLKELIERIAKQERNMKVAVMAADQTSELANNWDSLGKVLREEQTGLLLGSIKDQDLFNIRFPYGSQEKEMELGDGYFIVKNKFTGLRTATFLHQNEKVMI